MNYLKYRNGIVKSLKLAVANSVYYSGILSLYKKQVMRNSALILAYHRVVEGRQALPDYSSYGISVDSKTFEEHLVYLKSNFALIALSDLIDLWEGGNVLPDNLCAITFDDGWRDNYEVVFPLLKKHEIPATIFVTTNLIEGKEYHWEERVKYLLTVMYQFLNTEEDLDSYHVDINEYSEEIRMGDLKEQGINTLPGYLTLYVEQLRDYEPEKRNSILNAIEEISGVIGVSRHFLSWDEISEMSKAGIEFSAHSVTHPDLLKQSDEEVFKEIVDSKTLIESRLGKSVTSFAYPYGKFDERIISITKNAGIKAAFTIERGLNKNSTNPLKLRRVDIYQDVSATIPFYACRVLGFMGRY